jgi:hypothetical protein
MALSNLIDIEFTDQELKDLDAHLDGIQAIIKNKVVQLTPKESQRYGKLGNETENWVNMIHADSKQAPDLVPVFIDKAAWDKDEKARDQLSDRATRLADLSRQVTDTNRLLGFDIFNTCSTVYQNARFLSTKNAPGSKAYYDKWKVQFEKKDGGDDGDTPKQP